MKIIIKNRFDNSTIHEGYYISLMEAVSSCVKSGADLSGADLSRANLSRADLSGADLFYANLSGADLSGADLSGADLSRANLSGADLSRANLSRADLSGADLSRANLSDANLSRANLDLTIPSHLLAWSRTRILGEGDLIGWKKCESNFIVKLLIPAKAKRSHAWGRKCRCEYAKVLAVFDGKKKIKAASTCQHGPVTRYAVGKIVRPDSFDPDWRKECAPGIHFYITREEAEAH